MTIACLGRVSAASLALVLLLALVGLPVPVQAISQAPMAPSQDLLPEGDWLPSYSIEQQVQYHGGFTTSVDFAHEDPAPMGPGLLVPLGRGLGWGWLPIPECGLRSIRSANSAVGPNSGTKGLCSAEPVSSANSDPASLKGVGVLSGCPKHCTNVSALGKSDLRPSQTLPVSPD